MPYSPRHVSKFRYHHVVPFSHAEVDRVYRLFLRKVNADNRWDRRLANDELKCYLARLFQLPNVPESVNSYDVVNVVHRLHQAYPHSLMRYVVHFELDKLRKEYNDDSDDEDDVEIQEQHNRDAQRTFNWD